MIYRKSEESLLLFRVNLHSNHMIRTSLFYQFRHQLSRNRFARRRNAILSSIRIIRNNNVYASRKRPLHRIQNDKKLYQFLVNIPSTGLNNKNIISPNRLNRSRVNLSTSEFGNSQFAQFDFQFRTNSLRQIWMGTAGENS